MKAKKLQIIIKELAESATLVSEEEVQALADIVKEKKRIFLAGAGRSGLAARAFTNRLLHMGFDVHFVGEISCPPIQKDDLLIVGSGSGTTGSLIVMCKKAKNVDAQIATITMFPTHEIGALADVVVSIPGSTQKKEENEKNPVESVQPMGNLFEQLSWLVYDSVIMVLMDELRQTSEEMMTRHTNLE